MPNNSMNFGVDLIPTTNNSFNLGSSEKKWNLYVNQINGVTPNITIAGQALALGGTLSSSDLASALGISNAMHFKGTVTTAPNVTNDFNNYESGDVILYNSKEYVFNKGATVAGSSWVELGDESSFKVKQTEVTDTIYNGTDTATTFVSAVTQNANGVVTIEKRKLPNSSTSVSGIVQLTDSYTSTDDTLAATGKSILAAINTLDVTAVGVNADIGNKFICKISEADGKISATLSTKSLGSSTKSIYLDAGEIKEGNLYAGGTKVTLNNSDKSADTAEFYAPTGAGTTNQVLISGGSGTAPSWITNLSVSQGGTGVTSFAANSLIMSGSTTTGALTTRAITNNTTATAIPNDSTNIPTLKTIYYGLPTINNAHTYTSSTSIYAPTSAGTANQILVSAGGTSAPTWLATAAGAAYASGTNNSLTFGTLSVGYGGTGQTSFTAGNVLLGNGSDGFTTIAKTSDSTASTIVVRDASKNFSTNKITLSEGIDTPLTSGTSSIISIASKIATISSGVINMSYFNSGTISNQPSLNWYYTKTGTPNTDVKIGSMYWDIASKQGTFLNIISSTISESFTLPEPTTTITENQFYNIITTKGMGAGALYATGSANNTLTWNTLPLDYGGTGVTSLADLFSEIKGNGSDGLGDATWVNVSGDTITGQLILSSTTTLASNTTSGGPLVIGTKTGSHLAFDYNSIMAKSNTDVSAIYLNEYGGNIYMLKSSDSNYAVTIRSTATSSSTSTGALRVSGGIGITGASYFGSTLTTAGNITIGTTSATATKKITIQSTAGGLYLQAGSTSTANRTLSVAAHGTGSAKDIIVIDTNNNVNLYGSLTGNVTGNLTGNADTASLLKPIATSTTTASASTWGIPTGGYQVWGECFSDTRLKYTNSNNEEVTITDTGDWTIWLTPAADSNIATLNMKIDGTYYGAFNGNITGNLHPPVNGGIYWDPYVESSSDSSDAASIYQIATGVAGGTELRISQQNDSGDVINLCAPYYIYLNSKRAFTIYDSWLRINEDSGFSSGIYTGTSLIRSDAQLQVGSSGTKFYANSSGNGYFSNTLGIAGTNTNYKLYVNGTSYFNGAGTIAGNFTATSGGIFRIDHTGQGAKTKGTAYSAFYLTFKNSTNDATYYANPIRYIGTDGTDTYNTCVVLGSDNGTTWVGAGESSSYLPNKIAYNDENLYLSADGNICFYTSGANDGSSYTYAGQFSSNNLLVNGLINNFKINVGTGINADDVRTTNGLWISAASITNAAMTNHGALIGLANVGTPSQFYIPDSSTMYIYKRWYSSNAWSAWTKIYAGYADSAGSATTATRLTDLNTNDAASSTATNRYIWIAYDNNTTGRPAYTSNLTYQTSTNTLNTYHLHLKGTTSATMTAASTNPKITFSEGGTQPVHLIYTDYDNYRSPAGLKIIGGDSATPAWFEVEGAVFSGSYIQAKSTGSSWIDGQRYARCFNLTDATDTGSYWPWIRQTNTSSAKWFSVGVLNTSLYVIGSATSRTENSYDYGWRFDMSNGYMYGNVSGNVCGTVAGGTLKIGSAGGYLNNNATNGGINSIMMGDDVWLGDCNAAGIMGMKSTSTNCGFYFYNSSGTQTGQFYNNGSNFYMNKLLLINTNGNTVTIGAQNNGFCHIYNSADIPFIFNKTVCTTAGGLGNTSYRWGTSYFNGEINIVTPNGLRIGYGSKAMIFRNDGGNFYFLPSDTLTPGDNWTSVPLYYSFSDGTLHGTLTGNASNVSGTVAVGHGGTGATGAKGARDNLEAAPYFRFSGKTFAQMNSTLSAALDNYDVAVVSFDGTSWNNFTNTARTSQNFGLVFKSSTANKYYYITFDCSNQKIYTGTSNLGSNNPGEYHYTNSDGGGAG